MQFRQDIQGLRALAFLLVFIFHLNSTWLPGGFVGVDVFFVISGYLITSIILNQKSNNTFSFISFYKKRVQRIVPAQLFLVFVVLLVGSVSFLYSDIYSLRKWLVSSSLYFSNVIFSSGESYFGTRVHENPLLHTWSLSIEMQFYLLFPLFIVFTNGKYLKFAILTLIILLSIGCWYFIVKELELNMYFSLLARIPEFLVGAFFYVFFAKNPASRKISVTLSIVGYVLILGSALFLDEKTPFPGIIALIPCLGAGLLLVSSKNHLTALLSNKVSVFIGELSYSMYLWHWPIMAFIRYNNDQYVFTIIEILIIVIWTVLGGYLSYKFIENKFRVLEDRRFYKIIIPFSAVLLLLSYNLPNISRFQNLPSQYSEPSFGIKSHASGIPERLGDSTVVSRILLIGDSNALALKKFFDVLGKKNHFSFLTITTNTYPPIEGLNVKELKDDVINPNQVYDFNLAAKIAKTTKSYIDSSDVIIINCTRFDRIPSEIAAIANLAEKLASHQKLILINSFPKLDRNPIRLNQGITKKGEFEFQNIQLTIPEALIKMASEKRNVFIYDVSKSKIFENGIIPYHNDTVIYYDKSHLNDYGSKLLAEDLASDFQLFWFNNII